MKTHKNTFNPKCLVMAIAVSLSTFALLGCGAEAQPPVQKQSIKPALTEVVQPTYGESLSFNGEVRAAERAELSFRIGGRLSDVYVQEGQKVAQGELLAKLDSRDAKTALASAKIELENVKAEYLRAKAIYDKSKAISKSSLDEITARYNLAKNRYSEAERQLDYTKIEAPFAGIIGKKWVDNHTQVQANATVFTLHDLQDLEVVIQIPDSVMLSGLHGTKAQAEISAIPRIKFDLSLRTYATQADANSQSYAVVLGFDDVQGYRVLPGMAVKVYPAQADSQANADKGLFTLPVTAIVPDNQGKQFVWVVGDNNTVAKRFVEVGNLHKQRVQITDNLEQGERVVIAGVTSLRDGMQVRPMLNEEAKQ
ncbi:efflux RND transporter periplasmic adaptor subunit [Vibrio sp. LaRot3]|uniref:efflux RND transporter periplasmic adaptor subunit n=1 Tax=Vibrio sp. LaRot3 TaxID=2998829 RepID=UPI003FCD12E7